MIRKLIDFALGNRLVILALALLTGTAAGTVGSKDGAVGRGRPQCHIDAAAKPSPATVNPSVSGLRQPVGRLPMAGSRDWPTSLSTVRPTLCRGLRESHGRAGRRVEAAA